METIIYPILIAALAIATVTDLKAQRISNKLTFPLILIGLALHSFDNGLDGLLFSAAGLGVGFGVMIVPYIFGVMGAGDVKLMAGAGSMLGTSGVLHAFILTSLIGGLYALIVLIRHWPIFIQVLKRFKESVLCFMATQRFAYVPVEEHAAVNKEAQPKLPRLCYGVAIAIGTVLAIIMGLGTPSALNLLVASL